LSFITQIRKLIINNMAASLDLAFGLVGKKELIRIMLPCWFQRSRL